YLFISLVWQEDFVVQDQKQYALGDYLKFFIPSFLGIFLLMVPISINGEMTLMVAIWADFMDKYVGFAMPSVAVFLIVFSFMGALYTKLARPSFTKRSGFLTSLFD